MIIASELLMTLFVIYVCSNFTTNAQIEILYTFFSRFIKDSYLCILYILYPEEVASYIDSEEKDVVTEKSEDNIISKPEVKYENKYLNDIRKMDKEYNFNEEEKKLEELKFTEFFDLLKNNYFKKIEEIKNKLSDIEFKLSKYEVSSEEDYCNVENSNSDDDDSYLGETKDDKIKSLMKMSSELNDELKVLSNTYKNINESGELIYKAKEDARQFVINERLDKLKNNFIIEKTPLGNVLMVYNNQRGSFEYYSDNTIPYRYLETVGRKYVKVFNCRPIFVDMEEELTLCEERLQKEKEEKDRLEEEEKKQLEELKSKNLQIEPKKNVFAKFKSYNKEAGTGRVNMVAPPKNSIPNKAITETKSDEKLLLKEKANRYTYEGKMSNFSFLKKIERKIVDKKYGMTFADFKKNILNKK